MESDAEEFGDPVGRQSPKPDLAAAFEDLMDREVALEDEVAAVLDLPDWDRSSPAPSAIRSTCRAFTPYVHQCAGKPSVARKTGEIGGAIFRSEASVGISGWDHSVNRPGYP
jgi:hypothetical protein